MDQYTSKRLPWFLSYACILLHAPYEVSGRPTSLTSYSEKAYDLLDNFYSYSPIDYNFRMFPLAFRMINIMEHLPVILAVLDIFPSRDRSTPAK